MNKGGGGGGGGGEEVEKDDEDKNIIGLTDTQTNRQVH